MGNFTIPWTKHVQNLLLPLKWCDKQWVNPSDVRVTPPQHGGSEQGQEWILVVPKPWDPNIIQLVGDV